jgi:hypothetical protein
LRRRKYRRYGGYDSSQLAVAFGSGLLAAMLFSTRLALIIATIALICVASRSRR